MPKAIVIPLYDHADAREIGEILDRLAELSFSIEPYAVELAELPGREPELHSVRHDLHGRELRILADATEELGIELPCTCGGNGICLACAIASIERSGS